MARDVVMTCVRSYRESMDEFSQLRTLELWCRAFEMDELLAGLPPKLRKGVQKRIGKERAESRGEEMFPKLAEQRGNIHVLKDQLPTIFHHEDHPPGDMDPLFLQVKEARASAPPDFSLVLGEPLYQRWWRCPCWWLGCVSLPVFRFLLLRWYFRLVIWARFLWQVSRLKLALVPTLGRSRPHALARGRAGIRPDVPAPSAARAHGRSTRAA